MTNCNNPIDCYVDGNCVFPMEEELSFLVQNGLIQEAKIDFARTGFVYNFDSIGLYVIQVVLDLQKQPKFKENTWINAKLILYLESMNFEQKVLEAVIEIDDYNGNKICCKFTYLWHLYQFEVALKMNEEYINENI